MAQTIANQRSLGGAMEFLAGWYRRFEEAGGCLQDLQADTNCPLARVRHVVFARHRYSAVCNFAQAEREIMGANFIWPEQLMAHFGVCYTPEQWQRLHHVGFSPATLRASSLSHLLFPGFPMSVRELAEKFPSLFEGFYNDPDTYLRDARPEVRWYLMSMMPAPQSVGLSFEQGSRESVRVYAEIPRLCELALGVLLAFFVKGARLFPDTTVFCSDRTAVPTRAYLGDFRQKIFINSDGDGYASPGRGIAVFTKPDVPRETALR